MGIIFYSVIFLFPLIEQSSFYHILIGSKSPDLLWKFHNGRVSCIWEGLWVVLPVIMVVNGKWQ